MPNAAKYTVQATSSMCTRFRTIALMRTIKAATAPAATAP